MEMRKESTFFELAKGDEERIVNVLLYEEKWNWKKFKMMPKTIIIGTSKKVYFYNYEKDRG